MLTSIYSITAPNGNRKVASTHTLANGHNALFSPEERHFTQISAQSMRAQVKRLHSHNEADQSTRRGRQD